MKMLKIKVFDKETKVETYIVGVNPNSVAMIKPARNGDDFNFSEIIFNDGSSFYTKTERNEVIEKWNLAINSKDW